MMNEQTAARTAYLGFCKNIAIVAAICIIVFAVFAQPATAATGTVNYNTTYQQLEGFGGAAVYDVTALIAHSQRETIYDLLFKDLGLDVLRIRNCVGYDDSSVTATKTIVAEARELQRNPNLTLELVPWSPPGSLKSTGTTNGGTLAGGPSNYVYAAYADWWADSLETWASGTTGLIPDYISIQNEPDYSDSGYDTCRLNPTENTTYAGYDKAFQAVYNEIYSRQGSNMPKMIAPETMGITGGTVGGAGPYIDALDTIGQINHIYGFSHHLYSDGSYDSPDGLISKMQTFATNYGDYYNKPLFMTEYVRLNTTPNFDMALKMAHHIYNTLYYEGVTSYYHWTLFRSGSSTSGGAITLDSSSSYIIRDVYWFLKHYSYFTDPGWYVINTSTDSTNLRMAAFKNPENDMLTIVITNISLTANETITLNLNGFSFEDSEVYRSSAAEHWSSLGTFNPSQSLALPAQSITTIALYAPTGPQQTLTISSTAGGSVTTPGEGDFQYTQDTNAIIVATADQYYHFLNWTGTAVTAGKVANPNAANTTVLMDANYTVIANFEADPPDIIPPTPNPMTWASLPTATGPTTITMTATTAVDENPPVEYYFECNDANKSSSWQTSPTYIAGSLTPLTQYLFRVKARDSYLTPNETVFSETASATTSAPGTNIEILNSWTTGTTHTKESGYNRALIFIAHQEATSGNPILTSVTYGGQPMTKIIDANVGSPYSNYVGAFILNETGVAAATSENFVPTWSGTTSSVSYASVFLSNVDQTALIGATAGFSTATGSPNPVTTSALATNDGDMVIDAVTSGNNGSYTFNNAFTEGTDQSVGTYGHTGATGYKAATGFPETPSATFSGTLNRQVIIGFVVKAAAIINDPPAAPTNLTATADNGIVALDWNDNNETDFAGYNIYRSTISGSGYSKLNVSLMSNSDYIDYSVSNGITYYYVVTAVDDTNNQSGYSNEESATPDYQDCNDVQGAGFGLLADFTGDCYVNYEDLDIITNYWLNTDCGGLENCSGSDFEPDGDVDFVDFSAFALQWMNCNNPQDAECIYNW